MILLYVIDENTAINHFFVPFFFSRSFSFFLAQFYRCFSMNISLNFFQQYSHSTVTTFLSQMFSSAASNPQTPSSQFLSFSYCLIALIADLKSSEAAFQFSPVFVLSNPLPLVAPIFFFYSILVCFTMFACYLDTSLLASELNYFLLDMNTSLHALACFQRAFLLNFLPQPQGHITRSFSLQAGIDSSAYYSLMGFYYCEVMICFEGCFSIFCGGSGGSGFGSSFLGGGYSLLTSSLGGSLAIRILFCIGILGGSKIDFFSSKVGQSFKTSLSSLLVYYGILHFWVLDKPFEEFIRLFCGTSAILQLIPCFQVDCPFSILPFRKRKEVRVLLPMADGSYVDFYELSGGRVSLRLPSSEWWKQYRYRFGRVFSSGVRKAERRRMRP